MEYVEHGYISSSLRVAHYMIADVMMDTCLSNSCGPCSFHRHALLRDNLRGSRSGFAVRCHGVL